MKPPKMSAKGAKSPKASMRGLKASMQRDQMRRKSVDAFRSSGRSC